MQELKNQRSRRGIALLITIMFVAAMMLFASFFFERTARALKMVNDRQNALETNVLLFELANKVLPPLVDSAKQNAQDYCLLADDKKACQDDVLGAIYDVFYSLPITILINDYTAALACRPYGTMIDINSLKVPSSAKEDDPVYKRREIVERYLQEKYRLHSVWQLYELLDFVFDDTGERFSHLRNDRRLNVSNTRFEHSFIGSKLTLTKIMADYALLTHETTMAAIDWEKIFVFDAINAPIDFKHLTDETCAMIFGSSNSECRERDQEMTTQVEQMIRTRSPEAVSAFGVQFGINNRFDCRVRIGNAQTQYRFLYDADSKKLSNFNMPY